MRLNDQQIDLYSRQILVPEVGGRGQEALLQSSVCAIGSSPALTTALAYLDRAGVGRGAPDNSDLLLFDRGADQSVPFVRTPSMIIDDASGQFLRGLARGVCLTCADLAFDRPNVEPTGPAGSATVGAAVALDALRTFLDLASDAPTLIAYSGLGFATQDVALPERCGHRGS